MNSTSNTLSTNAIPQEPFETICEDGVVIRGVLLLPKKQKALIQFNCGTATKKEFYLPFLTYLAQHGYVCCLWDYRGSGASAPKNMSKCSFTYSDYGLKDMPAIKRYLENKFPNLPFLIFGHSAGGQQIGFMDDLDNIAGVVNFAVSTGYAPHMPFSYRIQSFYFFYIFTPLSILFTGYLTAKKFGIMEDLPAGVVTEWKAWCTKKDYFFDTKFFGKSVPKGNFKTFDFPIHTFWTVDDTISNEKNLHFFWKHIKSTKPISFTKLVPSEIGEKQIGHFGLFKSKVKDKIWGKVLVQLDEFSNSIP